jgi:hypothetical protein
MDPNRAVSIEGGGRVFVARGGATIALRVWICRERRWRVV